MLAINKCINSSSTYIHTTNNHNQGHNSTITKLGRGVYKHNWIDKQI